MIIAYDTPGQLGNQLWAYTALIANAKQLQVSVVIILHDSNYAQLDFVALSAAKADKVFIINARSFKARLIRKIVAIFLVEKKNRIWNLIKYLAPVSIINDSSFKITKKKIHVFLVNAWIYRANNLAFLKESDFIRSIIIPESDIKTKAEEQINELRKQFKIVVAVHIRRGDYLQFLDGKYYYEDDVYKDKMLQIASLFMPNEIVFSIFSNEKINTDNFCGLNVSFVNGNTAIGDMWAISICDYVIGPLSTFSMWASFWKKVPLLFIEKSTTINSLDIFTPVIAQDLQGAVT
jgi:hypothetical protein